MLVVWPNSRLVKIAPRHCGASSSDFEIIFGCLLRPFRLLDSVSLVLSPLLCIFATMPSPEEASTSAAHPPSFKSIGLIDPLLDAVEQLGYKTPTDIQAEALPHALEGRDIIGVASTGSGKTAAFALPIIQALWNDPKGLFACVIAPTRELAYQISQQFEALGSGIGVRCAVIIGGMDVVSQSIALAKKPHIVVATPGRLNYHLENTKGFSLRGLKFFVRVQAFYICYLHLTRVS